MDFVLNERKVIKLVHTDTLAHERTVVVQVAIHFQSSFVRLDDL